LVVAGSQKVSDAGAERQGGIVSPERRLEILDSLRSVKCEGCGGKKQAAQSHCKRCYFKLSAALRLSLYKRFGNGYEEAFEESLLVLEGFKPK
jgi:hypothetical protein